MGVPYIPTAIFHGRDCPQMATIRVPINYGSEYDTGPSMTSPHVGNSNLGQLRLSLHKPGVVNVVLTPQIRVQRQGVIESACAGAQKNPKSK